VAFFVPCTSTFTANQTDRELLRYWKLEVDTDDDGVLEDVSDYIANNSLSISAPDGSGAAASVLVRRSLSANVGDYANADCRISAKIGGSEYIVVFTGYVKPEGVQRTRDATMQDVYRLDMEDRTRRYTTRRKVSPAILANYTICKPTATNESIFHYLASAMGLSSGNVVCSEIAYIKPYLPLKGGQSPWHEMKKLAEQFRAEMYFRYDGKLLFDSPFQAGWTEPASEITLDVDNVHKWTGRKREIVCNRVICEFDDYEALSARPIYKNTENWQEDTQQCSIAVGAGEYWPGPTSNDTAVLHYKDPGTGENYPIATGVSTPTLGATAGGYDIESSGGTMTLSSFNGSNDRTDQHADASEIILKNNNGGSVTITRLVVRGTPVVVRRHNKLKDEDATISDEWEFIEKTIPGDYAISTGQVHETTQWWQEYGSTARYEYDIACDWLPQVQRGAVVRFDAPGVPSAIYAKVLDYRHPAANGPMGQQITSLRLAEHVSGFTASGTGENQSSSTGIAKPQRVVVGASAYTGVDALFDCHGATVATVINKAIAYVYNTHGGGTVELSEGNFPITSHLSLLTNVTLQGRGWNTVIEKNCDDYGINIAGADADNYLENIILRDFKITRNAADTNGKQLLYSIYAKKCLFDRLDFYDADQEILQLTYTQDCTWRNCVFEESSHDIYYSYYYAVTVGVYSRRNVFEGCHFLNNGVAVRFTDTANYCALLGCVLSGNIYAWQYCIYLNSDYNRVVNCVLQDNYGGINISAGADYNQVVGNYAIDNGNLIDYWTCEYANAPHITGDGSSTLHSTWVRDSGQKYGGSYSYKLTKTSAAGAGTAAGRLVDNTHTDDLHGLVAGRTYKLTAWVYVPSTGGPVAAKVKLTLAYYDSAAWTYTTDVATGQDAWEQLESEVTIPATATGTMLAAIMDTDAVQNKYCYFDNFRLQPIGITNSHSQQFSDGGTGTKTSGNSWE
jgi:parallel beta-helix repeat protein